MEEGEEYKKIQSEVVARRGAALHSDYIYSEKQKQKNRKRDEGDCGNEDVGDNFGWMVNL